MNKIYKEYLENGVIDEDNAVDIIEEQGKEIKRLNNVVNSAINFINYCETDVNFGIEISESTKCELLEILKEGDK